MKIIIDKLTIEKNIPMPAKSGRSTALSQALHSMVIGDSIVVPKTKSSYHCSARQVGIKIQTRSISATEYRLWRIA